MLTDALFWALPLWAAAWQRSLGLLPAPRRQRRRVRAGSAATQSSYHPARPSPTMTRRTSRSSTTSGFRLTATGRRSPPAAGPRRRPSTSFPSARGSRASTCSSTPAPPASCIGTRSPPSGPSLSTATARPWCWSHRAPARSTITGRATSGTSPRAMATRSRRSATSRATSSSRSTTARSPSTARSRSPTGSTSRQRTCWR